MAAYRDEMFPAYSPDINWVIEKAWREVQRRVLARSTEISSRATMKAIIIEEWKYGTA